MKLVERRISEIPNLNGYKKTKNMQILDEFVQSGMECAEVMEFTNKTASSCANSLRATIEKQRYGGITAISRNNKAYLIRL